MPKIERIYMVSIDSTIRWIQISIYTLIHTSVLTFSRLILFFAFAFKLTCYKILCILKMIPHQLLFLSNFYINYKHENQTN